MKIAVGILTISDRASQGFYEDKSGPALRRYSEEKGWVVKTCLVIPDLKEKIQEILLDWCDSKQIPLILTTGGTGISPRDVTPEATREIMEKVIPGIAEQIRQEGFKKNIHSLLSRGLAGTRGKSFILNLPGSPKGAVESLEIVAEIIPHAILLLNGGSHD